MKKLLLFLGLVFSLLLLMFFKKKEETTLQDNNRFKYYKPVDTKLKTIKVMYLTWGNRNLPNFIKVEDYKRFSEQEKLIQYCFYVDSKNPKAMQFTEKIKDNFVKKIPVELTGRFYKTTQFDSQFPSNMFEALRKTNDLGFKTPNDEFLVFVID